MVWYIAASLSWRTQTILLSFLHQQFLWRPKPFQDEHWGRVLKVCFRPIGSVQGLEFIVRCPSRDNSHEKVSWQKWKSYSWYSNKGKNLHYEYNYVLFVCSNNIHCCSCWWYCNHFKIVSSQRECNMEIITILINS